MYLTTLISDLFGFNHEPAKEPKPKKQSNTPKDKERQKRSKPAKYNDFKPQKNNFNGF